MALLRFHFQFSILCLLAISGFLLAFRKKIVENGWGKRVKCGKLKGFFILLLDYFYLAFFAFVPIMNVTLPFTLYHLATHEAPEKEAA